MVSNSNVAKACPKCYLGAGLRDICSKCGGETEVVNLGTRITLPKKGDRRAWKRIFNGEKFWDRRRVKRSKMGSRADTYIVYEYEIIPVHVDMDCEHECCKRPYFRSRRIPSSGKERTNMRRKPDVDLGG